MQAAYRKIEKVGQETGRTSDSRLTAYRSEEPPHARASAIG
jgi:hypothetical protein